MTTRRVQRLNEQIRRELSDILRNEVRDPRVGVMTVTGVETTPDLDYARVYLNVVGDEAEKQEALEGLRSAASFARTELGKRLRVRRVPELHFELDRTLDYAMRIERLLGEVLPAESREAPSPAEESSGEEE